MITFIGIAIGLVIGKNTKLPPELPNVVEDTIHVETIQDDDDDLYHDQPQPTFFVAAPQVEQPSQNLLELEHDIDPAPQLILL